jgi:hypothetical protein
MKTLVAEAEIWLSIMRSHQRDQALSVTRGLQLGASSIRTLVVLKVSSRLIYLPGPTVDVLLARGEAAAVSTRRPAFQLAS